MTFEIIILVLVGAFVVSGLLMRKTAATQAPSTTNARGAQPPATVPLVQKMAIDGTESYRGEYAFVKQFGLVPGLVREVRLSKGFSSIAEAPGAVRKCLEMLKEEGRTRGSDVVRLTAGLQVLQPGHAVYFVLSGADEMVAFQDLAR